MLDRVGHSLDNQWAFHISTSWEKQSLVVSCSVAVIASYLGQRLDEDLPKVAVLCSGCHALVPWGREKEGDGAEDSSRNNLEKEN